MCARGVAVSRALQDVRDFGRFVIESAESLAEMGGRGTSDGLEEARAYVRVSSIAIATRAAPGGGARRDRARR